MNVKLNLDKYDKMQEYSIMLNDGGHSSGYLTIESPRIPVKGEIIHFVIPENHIDSQGRYRDLKTMFGDYEITKIEHKLRTKNQKFDSEYGNLET